MALPLVVLTGSPYQQGVQHGQALRQRIRHNLEVYAERFQREARLERPEVLRRAALYRQAIDQHSPAYGKAMRGVADGSGCALDEIAALNVRYEILYFQFGLIALESGSAALGADGCTSFAVLPSATRDGHLLMGQNWDWIPQVQGALLETRPADRPRTLTYTEAGIVGGKMGLNSAGLGLAINGLTTTHDDWSRLAKPFHVRCYEVLQAADLDAAVSVIAEGPRSCAANFLVAQAPDRVVDLETAPDGVHVVACRAGRVVHTNHFVDPAAAGVVEPPLELRPHSEHRLARMSALLEDARPVSPAALRAALRDHADAPYGICRHPDPEMPPEERYATVASTVMDLGARSLWVADGPPCQTPFVHFGL